MGEGGGNAYSRLGMRLSEISADRRGTYLKTVLTRGGEGLILLESFLNFLEAKAINNCLK